jgi:predicted TIM-barrel fold metal-dependent hydrolase
VSARERIGMSRAVRDTAGAATRGPGAPTGGARPASRRDALRTAAGIAAGLLALNARHGRFFAVEPAEARDPEAAPRAPGAGAPGPFVCDVQTHHGRDNYTFDPVIALLRAARGESPPGRPWAPALAGRAAAAEALGFEAWVTSVFLESDTTVAVLGGWPAEDRAREPLTSDEIVRSRDLVNRLTRARRVLAHGLIRPGRPGALDEMERLARHLRVDSWKGDPTGDVTSEGPFPWRLDDEKIAYPVWERAAKLGIRIVFVRKGLLPAPDHRSARNWRFAAVDDVGRAARDWPQIDFVVEHAAFRSVLDAGAALDEFRQSGRIPWVTDLAEIPLRYAVRNVHAALGTAFASTVATAPELTAAILGQLVKGMGPDHVLWGTDSVWYGSPQWQIEAFQRFEIPEVMQQAHGFVPLSAGNGRVKRMILGENAAWLYGLKDIHRPPAPVPRDFKERLPRLEREARPPARGRR